MEFAFQKENFASVLDRTEGIVYNNRRCGQAVSSDVISYRYAEKKGSPDTMKKKIVWIVVCAVVMMLPTVIAIISYTHAQANPVTADSVSAFTLTTPDAVEHSFTRSDKQMLNCFLAMNENAEVVPNLLMPTNAYTVYTVSYVSYNKTSHYTYYLTQDPNNAFYMAPNGDIYHISPDAVGGFLETKYATPLFPEASQPILTVAGTHEILPNEMTWKYVGFNGQFLDSKVNLSDEILRCDVSGGLQLSFDRQPDHLFVTLTNESGEVVFQDVYEKMDSSLFADNTVYHVSLTAKWYQSEGRENFGEATYSFEANVQSPAVFYVSTNETLRYGDFVIISVKNVVDPSQIGFTSLPALDITPTFFEYRGYYHAIVPFSLALEDANGGVLKYRFTMTYGDVSQEIDIQLDERSIKSAYINIPAADVAHYRSEAALEEFARVMKTPLMANETTLYWMQDNMLIPPTTRSVHVGFGLKVIHSEARVSYQNETVKFKVRNGDTAAACLPGKVVYVGETTYSGKTVVVEHGGGLKSVYANLSLASVSVGDIIQKGHIVGYVGNTGLTEGTTLNFSLYVYDIPVRYYNYEEDGVSVADAVAKAIGILPDITA